MKTYIAFILIILVFHSGYSSKAPLLSDKQILKELRYLIDKVQAGIPINSSSRLDTEMIFYLDDPLNETSVSIKKTKGKFSSPNEEEILVQVTPTNEKLPVINFLWDQKYTVLLFYQLKKDKWNLLSVNSFYNNLEIISTNRGRTFIKVQQDKCIDGKCEWLIELYTCTPTGSLIPNYTKRTFSNLVHLYGLLLDSSSVDNQQKISEFIKGDTLSYFLESLELVESKDTVPQISETITIGIFSNIDTKRAQYLLHTRKRILKLEREGFEIVTVYPLEEKIETLP